MPKIKLKEGYEHIQEHIPLKENKICYDDKEYIINNHISCLDLSKCVNYSFYAMPFCDFYDHYNKQELKENLLEMIHNAMYIKFSFYPEGFVGWAMLLGAIPYLLDLSDYDVKWELIYEIFKDFLDVSLINI